MRLSSSGQPRASASSQPSATRWSKLPKLRDSAFPSRSQSFFTTSIASLTSPFVTDLARSGVWIALGHDSPITNISEQRAASAAAVMAGTAESATSDACTSACAGRSAPASAGPSASLSASETSISSRPRTSGDCRRPPLLSSSHSESFSLAAATNEEACDARSCDGSSSKTSQRMPHLQYAWECAQKWRRGRIIYSPGSALAALPTARPTSC
jgi:hypothetical protein